ncbi:MAG: cupin domain-containing protein [Thiotrichaceae bacterium]|jgi:ribosomal protein L16 Arg81 hydroxylase|nr:cupin domain-containing protein [Thiotrichaceae bacterium]
MDITKLTNSGFFEHLTQNKPLLIKSFLDEKIFQNITPKYIHSLFATQKMSDEYYYFYNDTVKNLHESKDFLGTFLKASGDISILGQESTLIIRKVQDVIPEVNSLLTQFSQIIGYSLNSNLYLSTSSSTGFKMHHDPHYVFAVQLYGAKKWILHPPKVEYPQLRYSFNDVNLQELKDSDSISFTTEQGDMLLIPLGWPHKAATHADASVHITVGYDPIRWGSVLEKLMIVLGTELSILRAPIPLSINMNGVQEYGNNLDKDDVRLLLEMVRSYLSEKTLEKVSAELLR